MRGTCLILAVVLGGVGGCAQNPGHLPYWLPAGPTLVSHPKPIAPAYFADYDPNAVRVELRPQHSVAAVGSRQVLIATVYDGDNQPRRNRRVEWNLEGVGSIIEVDESGFFPGRGYKLDRHFAVSFTDYFEHLFTRGNADPNDDFCIRPGQTWYVVSAPVEGQTVVTAYVPAIANWDAGQRSAVLHWSNTACNFPATAVSRAGTESVLTTTVGKLDGTTPLVGQRVRYRLLDGPAALLLPTPAHAASLSGGQELTVPTDAQGQAGVRIVQATPQAGVSRIAVEVLRPATALVPGQTTAHTGSENTEVVIRSSTTQVEWQKPQVAVAVVTPSAWPVGQEATLTPTISNTGGVELPAGTLNVNVPAGTELVRTEPPAQMDGDKLTWSVPSVPAGQKHAVRVVVRPKTTGALIGLATVDTADGTHVEEKFRSESILPGLTVSVPAPAPVGSGEKVSLAITVKNPGSGPCGGIVLHAALADGLVHATNVNPLHTTVGDLRPGEQQVLPLELMARTVGPQRVRVWATGNGVPESAVEVVVNVQPARLVLTATGPERLYVGKSGTWTLTVKNTGELPLDNVAVRASAGSELQLTQVGSGGTLTPSGSAAWLLGTLGAGESRQVQVVGQARSPAARCELRWASASSRTPEQPQSSAVEIVGIPAVSLDVSDEVDPVEVQGRTVYRVTVRNQGSLPLPQAVLTVTFPEQLKPLAGAGPVPGVVKQNTVTFGPIEQLSVGSAATFTLPAEAVAAGDARVQIELSCPLLQAPVRRQEPTRVVGGTR